MIKRLLVLVLVLILGVFVFLSLSGQSEEISSEQQQVLELWGDPSQFLVTYLPQKNGQQENLSRYEVWIYDQPAKKIIFLSGKLISSQDIDPLPIDAETNFYPWDFDFYSSLNEVKQLKEDVEYHLVDLPGFNENDLQTYSSSELLLVFEDDYLTYVQTLGFDPEQDLAPLEAELTEEVIKDSKTTSDSSDQLYANSDMGFEISYPPDWFLNNGVLTNYDTDYLFSGGSLPSEVIKCDFVPHQSQDFELGELELKESSPLQIYKTQVTPSVDDDGPGFGDNVVFLIEDNQHQPMTLVCFAYADNLESELISMLKTFKFLK